MIYISLWAIIAEKTCDTSTVIIWGILMKIIKQGHDEDRMQMVCNSCEAVLEITSDDLAREPSLDSNWGIYHYKCPCCGTEKYLEKYEMARGGVRVVCMKLVDETR